MSNAHRLEVDMKQNNNLETRVALLEQSIGHIEETLQRLEKNMAFGFEQMNKKFDNKFEQMDFKIDKLEAKSDKKFNHLDERFDKQYEIFDSLKFKINDQLDRFNSRLWTNFLWLLSTMFTLAGLAGGMMAKGFGWLGN